MNLHERLAVFFERLRAAPPCHDAEQAFTLVCHLIEEVEDEFCSIPREDPPPWHRTGRMYPPQNDLIFHERDGSIRAETRRHTMSFLPDGSIRITAVATGGIEFFKIGGTI